MMTGKPIVPNSREFMINNIGKSKLQSPLTINPTHPFNISHFISIEGDSGAHPITKRIFKNRKFLNSVSRNQSEDSTNSSPFYNKISPQMNLRKKFNASIPNQGQNSSMSSRVIYSLAENGTFQEHAKEQLEEDIGDSDFRRDFPQLLKPYTIGEDESKLRENLICKIKKV